MQLEQPSSSIFTETTKTSSLASSSRKRKAEGEYPRGPEQPHQYAAPVAPRRLSHPEGKLMTFGTNSFAQLGLGRRYPERKKPTPVRAINSVVVQVACGSQHTAAVDARGRVWTCGSNDEGALGRRTSRNTEDSEDEYIPQIVTGLPSNIKMLTCGDSHTIVLLDTGEVWGWGIFRDASNNNPGMGFIKAGRKAKEDAPVKIPGFGQKQVTAISSGSDHCLALTTDGCVFQWGDSCTCTHGNDQKNVEEKLVPQEVQLERRAVSVFAGGNCSFAVLEDGSVYAWGLDNWGQLGVNASPRDPKADQWIYPPRRVLSDFGGDKIRKIASTIQHTIFLTERGSLFACGCGHYGRLGIRDAGDQVSTPRAIEIPRTGRLVKRFVDIAVGELHSLACTKDGKLFSWGVGDNMQLGNGEDKEEKVPTEVVSGRLNGLKERGILPKKVIAVAAGSEHSALIAVPIKSTKPTTKSIVDLTGTSTMELDQAIAAPIQVQASAVTMVGSRKRKAQTDLRISGKYTNATQSQDSQQTRLREPKCSTTNRQLSDYKGGKLLTVGLNEYGVLGLPDRVNERNRPAVINSITTPIAKIACGPQHTLVLDVKGYIWTHGVNDMGELGRPTRKGTADERTPTRVKGLPTNIKMVTSGTTHNLVLLTTGELWGWGIFREPANENRKLGFIRPYVRGGPSAIEKAPVKLTIFEHKRIHCIASGSDHCLALNEDGSVWQWGDACTSSDDSQILSSGAAKLTPHQVPLSGKATAIFSGASCSFAVLEDGKVYAWGADHNGQLGVQSNVENRDKWVFPPKPVDSTFGGGRIRKIASAQKHTIFLTENGKVFACGSAHDGRLGLAEVGEYSLTPREVAFPKKVQVVDIAVADGHSVACTIGGEVYTWGSGDLFPLGTGRDEEEKTPKQVHGRQLDGYAESNIPKRRVIAVACGNVFSAFLGLEGEEALKQHATSSNIMHSTKKRRTVPKPKASLGKAESAMNNTQRQAWTANSSDSVSDSKGGKLLTVGLNEYGVLGLPDRVNERNRPAVINSITTPLAKIACGPQHTLVLDVKGYIWTHGVNDMGELGRPTRKGTADERTPTRVKGLPTNIKMVTSGTTHNLVLLTTGELWGWGIFREPANENRKLGFIRPYVRGGPSAIEKAPVKLTIFEHKRIHCIASGSDHCLALNEDGSVWQWGDACTSSDDSQILSSGVAKLTPHQVPLSGKATAIFSGASCSFAVLEDGKVYAWGADHNGQLGVQSNVENRDKWVFPPKPVDSTFGGGRIRKIASAQKHTIFLTENGKVFACGSAHDGRLGLANVGEYSLTPREVMFPKKGRLLKRVVDIAVADGHSVACTIDGEVYTWGSGDLFPLGTGRDEEEKTPRQVHGRQLDGFADKNIPKRQVVAVACGNVFSAFLGIDEDSENSPPQTLNATAKAPKRKAPEPVELFDQKGAEPQEPESPRGAKRMKFQKVYSQLTPLRIRKMYTENFDRTDQWLRENVNVEAMFRDGNDQDEKDQASELRREGKIKLMKFFANYDPFRKLSDIEDMINEWSRKGGNWFEELSQSLSRTYGARP